MFDLYSDFVNNGKVGLWVPTLCTQGLALILTLDPIDLVKLITGKKGLHMDTITSTDSNLLHC